MHVCGSIETWNDRQVLCPHQGSRTCGTRQLGLTHSGIRGQKDQDGVRSDPAGHSTTVHEKACEKKTMTGWLEAPGTGLGHGIILYNDNLWHTAGRGGWVTQEKSQVLPSAREREPMESDNNGQCRG